MWIVPTALVVLGVVLFLLFRGGGGDGGLLGGGDNTIPVFDFRLTKAVPILVTHNKPTKFDAAARDVGAQVGETMTTLYTEAFLDPANWRGGSYDEVWPLFEEGSQAAAQQDGMTLTLGPSAGDQFDRVDQPVGTLNVKVLLDRENQPATAVAIVKFKALASAKDGMTTAVVSTGQYFLRSVSDGWLVYAFSVSRGDHEVVVPSPGASASATGAPS
ncbi:MAG TPA: hypothetical protein VNA32_08700 [Actinomycetota bacterium]|nr:hypothetical protein [Actinomycetota bacterium]